MRKSFKNKQHFNNQVLGKNKKSVPSGIPRLFQLVCMMNRMAVTFSTFWVNRDFFESILKGEASDKFTGFDVLYYEQIKHLVAHFMEGVGDGMAAAGNEEDYLLFCAQHILKVLHAGLFMQSIFWIAGGSTGELVRLEGAKKPPAKEATVKEPVEVDLDRSGKGSVQGVERRMILSLVEVLTEKGILDPGFEQKIVAESGERKEPEPALKNFYADQLGLLTKSEKRVTKLTRDAFLQVPNAEEEKEDAVEGRVKTKEKPTHHAAVAFGEGEKPEEEKPNATVLKPVAEAEKARKDDPDAEFASDLEDDYNYLKPSKKRASGDAAVSDKSTKISKL